MCQPVRLDRLITLGLVQPLRKKFAFRQSRSQRRLPILMYHSVSDDEKPGVSDYHKVCTSAKRFAEQMQWLTELGWRGVTLEEGLESFTKPVRSSDRLVVITFDDGFLDFQTAAIPALRKHAFSATVYLPTAFIGNERCRFKDRECLIWSEVRELKRSGIEFGSHSVNHAVLTKLPWLRVEAELKHSKQKLEDELGSEVASFAYPYAFPTGDRLFCNSLAGLLSDLNYRNCVTTSVGRVGVDDDRFALKRLPVNDRDDRTLLEAKLDGGYDWICLPQTAGKIARHALRLQILSGRHRISPAQT